MNGQLGLLKYKTWFFGRRHSHKASLCVDFNYECMHLEKLNL